jgi:hypothetical protein
MNQKLPEPYELNIGQITKALDQNVKQLRVRRDIKRDLKKLNNKQSFFTVIKASIFVGLGITTAFLLQGGASGLRARSVQALRSIVHANEPRHFVNQPTNFQEQQRLILENQELRKRIIEFETSLSVNSIENNITETNDEEDDDDDYF